MNNNDFSTTDADTEPDAQQPHAYQEYDVACGQIYVIDKQEC